MYSEFFAEYEQVRYPKKKGVALILVNNRFYKTWANQARCDFSSWHRLTQGLWKSL